MRRFTLFYIFVLISLPMLLTGCELIEGIFTVGVWIGIIVTLLIVGLVIWVLSKIKG